MVKLVLMDFDGVFVNSRRLAFTIFSTIKPTFSLADFRELFSANAFKVLPKLFNIRELLTIKKAYGETGEYGKGLILLKPVSGMPKLLKELKAQGVTVIIISSSHGSNIHLFLQKYGLLPFVEHVLGADAGTSKREKIKFVLKKYHALPTQALFVTDSIGDVKEAQAADVQPLLVTWGYFPRRYLKQVAGAIPMVQAPHEILKVVA